MVVGKSSSTSRGVRRKQVLLLGTCILALQGATTNDQTAHLTPGATAALQVDSSQPAGVVLDVGRNQAAYLIVDQDEPSLHLQILSVDGHEIRSVSAGFPGLILVSLPPSPNASFHLVATASATRIPAALTISLETARLGSADLVEQSDAEQIFLQAQLLRREPSANSVKKAITLLRRARAHWRAGHSRSGQAVALAAQGDAWFQLSAYAAALRDYSLARQFASSNSRIEASLLNAEATVYLELWWREKAVESAKRALNISRTVHDGRGEADALANLAIAAYLLSQEGGNVALKEALDMARSRGNRVTMSRVLSVQAWLERDLGHCASSIELMDQSAQLFQQIGRVVDAMGEMLDIAATDGSCGDAYSAIVRHVKLVKLFHDAGSIFDEANGDNNIGLDYIGLNRPRDALPYFREARHLFASTGNAWAEQTALGLICETELSLKLYGAAPSDCAESKRIAVEFNEPLYMALADSRLGKLAESRGELMHAAAYYRRAAELSSSQGYSRGDASATMSLGLLQFRRAGPAAAIEFFEKALSLSQQAEDPAGIIEAKYQIANVHAETGHLDEAQIELSEATNLSELERRKIRSDQLRTSYFAAVRKCYDLYVDVLMRRHASNPTAGFDLEGIEKSEAARARTLFDALNLKTALPSRGIAEGSDLTKLRAALNDRYEKRLNLIVSGQKQRELNANASEIRRLSAQYDQALAVAADEAQPGAAAFKPIARTDLLRASSDAIILEYHLGEKRSYLWRIERGEIASFTLPDRKMIGDAVEKWRDLASARQRRPSESFSAYTSRVEAADRELTAQAAKLSCILLAGLRFEKDTKLVIVADGSLQSLPFAALPSDGCRSPNSPPLVVLHEVRNVSSLRILTAAPISPGASFKKDVAILADPVFSAHDPRVTKRAPPVSPVSPAPLTVALRDAGFGSELPRLYATRKEAEAIVAVAPRGSVLLALDFRASLETALSAELADYRIWHFATHGLLDKESPDLSGLVFSLVDAEGRSIPGYLKLQDIFDLSIHPALVVLSACGSGLGEQVEGEGAVGLSYAFLHAGAKQVISTLWNVDDNASSDLMAEFYRGLLQLHMSPASSLRQAQIALLSRKRASQPFYWAGYVLMSN
jgi:CHAT domain-containing protein